MVWVAGASPVVDCDAVIEFSERRFQMPLLCFGIAYHPIMKASNIIGRDTPRFLIIHKFHGDAENWRVKGLIGLTLAGNARKMMLYEGYIANRGILADCFPIFEVLSQNLR